MSDAVKDSFAREGTAGGPARDAGASQAEVAPEQPVTDCAGLKPLTPGTRVRGTITGITDYGAFLVTDDGRRGLIHISEITDWYVERAEDYFYKGERVEVEVVHFDANSGKYAFSTRRLGGKQPLANRYADRLLELHYHGTGRARPRGYYRERRANRGERRPHPAGIGNRGGGHAPAGAAGGAQSASAGGGAASQEAADLLRFLRRHVGEVSPAARVELDRLINTYGAARVALALAQVIENTDRSLQVVEAVGKRLAGS
ncbi:MAG TPA: S1 RNA-binding domain-containing protein [Thermaerobacter sp.]